MWCKVLYIADLFCLHGNIRLRNITISLFFGALKLFIDFSVFLVKISRLHSFIYNKFSKLTKLKMSHPKEQLQVEPASVISHTAIKIKFDMWSIQKHADTKGHVYYSSLHVIWDMSSGVLLFTKRCKQRVQFHFSVERQVTEQVIELNHTVSFSNKIISQRHI